MRAAAISTRAIPTSASCAARLSAASSGTNLSGTPIPVPTWQTNETATVNFGTDLAGLPLGDTVFTAHYYWQSRYLAGHARLQSDAA
jgi:hypothetical protein